MRKLMGGRSIERLRAEMAKAGYKIGTSTIHRAVKGEVGNRLESLEKLAEFFDKTVDQLLQFDGVDETYWPFSDELQHAVTKLSPTELMRAENVLRAHLGMPMTDGIQKDDAEAEQDSSVTEMVTGINTIERGKKPISTPSLDSDYVVPPSRGGGKKGVR